MPDTALQLRSKLGTNPMRIAGRKVDADGVIEVRYPYTGEVVGTVPAGRREHARHAFEAAAAYRSKLTRYERQQILFRAADAIVGRRDELSDLITLELGISKKDSALRGRPRL